MKRNALRFGAATVATSLVLLGIAPAQAAEPVSQSSAQAISLSIGGNPIEIDSVLNAPSVAINDGTGPVSVAPQPLASALNGQQLAITGVLGQGAIASVLDDRRGHSVACAGTVSDADSAVVAVGDDACNFDDNNVAVNFGNLLLPDDLEILPTDSVIGELLAPVLDEVNPLLGALLSQITDAVVPALEDVLAPLADLDLSVSLGAIESSCVALAGSPAQGTSSIANAGIHLTLAGVDLPVLNLDVDAPDGRPDGTALLSSEMIVDHLLPSLVTTLETALGGVLAPIVGPILDLVLGDLIDAIRDAVLEPLLDDLLVGLLDDLGLLSIVVNKQVPSHGGEAIEVTALDIQALAAVDALTVDLEIGKVSCGPNRLADVPTDPEPETPDEELPEVPTKVTSGVESAPGAGSAGLLAALLALGTAAGVIGFRRTLKA